MDGRRRDGRSKARSGPAAARAKRETRTGRGGGPRRSASESPADATQREPKRSAHPPVHLSEDIVAELRATARPGKGEILVKVFADAAGAFVEEDYAQAIELAEQAKHIALRSTTARELLGLAYYRSGRWKEAARELSAFRRISGSKAQNPVLADCYRAEGKPLRALELCNEIHPDEVDQEVFYEGAIVAAGALIDLGRVDEAITRLEVLDLRPPNVQTHHLRVWYVLADLLERRGRFSQAHEWFEAVAAADAELTDAPERARRLQAQ